MQSVLVIEVATPITIGILQHGSDGWSGFAFVDTKPIPIGHHVSQQTAIDRVAYIARKHVQSPDVMLQTIDAAISISPTTVRR